QAESYPAHADYPEPKPPHRNHTDRNSSKCKQADRIPAKRKQSSRLGAEGKDAFGHSHLSCVGIDTVCDVHQRQTKESGLRSMLITYGGWQVSGQFVEISGYSLSLRFHFAGLLIASLRLLLQSPQYHFIQPHIHCHFLRRRGETSQWQFARQHFIKHHP